MSDDEAVARLARRFGVGQTDIIRLAIAEYLEAHGVLVDPSAPADEEHQTQ